MINVSRVRVWYPARALALAAVAALIGCQDAQRPPAPALTLTAHGYDDERPDPVEANGPIFKKRDGEDWPRPAAVLVFTGEQDGYLEPCGCAGLTNQKGGLKRRHTLLKQLTADGWPVVALDAGGLIKRFGQQAQIKYRRSVESLVALGYRGAGFGVRDLRMDVLGVAINLDEDANPFTSANVGLLGFDETLSRRWRTAEAGGLKIGFTSVLSDKQAASVGANPDFDIEPAADALRVVTPQLAAEGCDELVLLVYGSGVEARELAKQFPAYRWVVSAVGADEPPHRIEAIEGTASHLIEVGHKGQYAVAVALYPNGENGPNSDGGAGKAGAPDFRYQKVPLDHRFEDSAEMQQMLVGYQDELKVLGFDGLGVKPQLHAGGKFAGSAACADCHDAEYEIWKGSPHAHATETLVELDPARHFDPECLSCHVTGWEPQKYHPFVSGYERLERSGHLFGNGCENCHGPAAEHAAAENGDIDADDAKLEALRAALHMEIVENEGNQEGQEFEGGQVVQNCVRCHDEDNSPDFDFQEYWPEVEHGGD